MRERELERERERESERERERERLLRNMEWAVCMRDVRELFERPQPRSTITTFG